jgi:hypothetical protein
MLKHMQPVLEILDDGIALYRSAFTSFALIVAIWVMPLFIGLGFSFWWAQFLSEGLFLLLLFAWTLITIPLAVYMVGSVSRAATAVQQQRPVRLREVMAIPPLRAVGTGCYGFLLLLLMNLASSMLSMICICPLYIGLFAVLGGVFSVGEPLGAAGAVIGVFLMLIFALVLIVLYGLGLVLTGSAYSIVVYGLQPFVQQNRSFTMMLQESIDLLVYRLGRNLLIFLGTSAVFGALSISVTIAISVLLPLPLILALGEQSLLAQGVSATAWMLGIIVVLPLLPIWMALLYERNVHDREGIDLAQRITVRYTPAERHELV